MLGSLILEAYEDSHFLDNYDIYDCLMNYWNEKLQDDVYAIKAYGYEAAREIEYTYAQKKQKDKDTGETITVEDKSKIKSFDGALIPRSIIESEYYGTELSAIAEMSETRDQLSSELEEMREEESGDDGLLKDVLSESGDLPKANLTKRLKELDAKKTSPEMLALTTLMEKLGNADATDLEIIAKMTPSIENYGIRNKNGTFAKSKLKAALKVATDTATVPEVYQEEYNALLAYQAKMDESDALGKEIKAAQKALDDLVEAKYGVLSSEIQLVEHFGEVTRRKILNRTCSILLEDVHHFVIADESRYLICCILDIDNPVLFVAHCHYISSNSGPALAFGWTCGICLLQLAGLLKQNDSNLLKLDELEKIARNQAHFHARAKKKTPQRV